VTDPTPAPIRWYALCAGEGMRLCESCKRNADNAGQIIPHQQWLSPTTDGTRCADWMGK
jgi:hypothetical protein